MTISYLQRVKNLDRSIQNYLMISALIGLTTPGIRAVAFNLYLTRIGYGPEFVGLVGAIGAMSMAIACLPAGLIVARLGSRRILILSVSLRLLSFAMVLLFEVVPGTWREVCIVASIMAMNVAIALYHVSGIPFIMSNTGDDERDYAFSLQAAVPRMMAFIGSLLGGILPELFGKMLGVSSSNPVPYRYALLLAGILFSPAILLVLKTREQEVKWAPLRLARNGNAPYKIMLFVGLCMALITMGNKAIQAFLNIYLDSELGTPTSLIGGMSAIAKLAAAPVALAIPLILSSIGKRRAIEWGMLSMILSTLPIILIPHWWGAALSSILLGILFSTIEVPFRIYSQELVQEEWRPAMSAMFIMSTGLGGSVVSLGGGYAIGCFGYQTLHIVGALCAAVAGLMFWFCFQRGKEDAGYSRSN